MIIENHINIIPATQTDIPDLVNLNNSWQKENLQNYEHGFLSVSYDSNFFNNIINNNDIFVFRNDDILLGYVLVNTSI